MKTMKTAIRSLALSLICTFLLSVSVFAAPMTVTARGEGVAPPNARPGQAEILARRAAILDAYRQLAEGVEAIIESESQSDMAMITKDEARLRTRAVIRNARIIMEGHRYGAYYVIMEGTL